MAIYESRGFGALLYPYKGKLEPFDYIAQFKPQVIPEGADIEEYKRTQAPYCLSGKVKADKKGSYRRNNDSLVYRDLVFLDYDEITGTTQSFIETVSSALFGYSYILYPTIKYTPEKPRFRLVVKPSGTMDENSYKQAIIEIAEKIGLSFDPTSQTWSQLQGLPVTKGNPDLYQRIIERGLDYPVPKIRQTTSSKSEVTYQKNYNSYKPRTTGQRSITMRVVDTLLNGFGEEGGRNVAVTRFVGLLLNKWVDCDVTTAYELTKIANSVTDNPLPIEELERTFESIVKNEIRKRGLRLSN